MKHVIFQKHNHTIVRVKIRHIFITHKGACRGEHKLLPLGMAFCRTSCFTLFIYFIAHGDSFAVPCLVCVSLTRSSSYLIEAAINLKPPN